MKMIDKSNGQIIAEGRFELSKISDMEIDTSMGKDTWIMFRYFCDNLIKKGSDFDMLHMVAELTVADSLINIEANGIAFNDDIRADTQLTTEERERLFVHIINHILQKDAQQQTPNRGQNKGVRGHFRATQRDMQKRL